LLDGGCGPGQASVFAAERGLVPIGVDITMEMLRVARPRLPAPRLVCADLLQLPLASGSIDAAICWFSLHNLPRGQLLSALVEIARVLRSRAPVVIATHGGTGEEMIESDGGAVVVTYYAPDELESLTVAAGYGNVTVRTRPPFDHEHQVPKLFLSCSVLA